MAPTVRTGSLIDQRLVGRQVENFYPASRHLQPGRSVAWGGDERAILGESTTKPGFFELTGIDFLPSTATRAASATKALITTIVDPGTCAWTRIRLDASTDKAGQPMCRLVIHGKVSLLALGLLAACQAKSKSGDDRDSGDPGTSGPGAGIHLPSCAVGEPVFTQLPHALSDLRSLGPLGHLAPSPHTFPSDHMYFSFAAGVAGAVVPLVSPGELTVTRVAVTDYLGATPPYSDYAVSFRPCQEVEIYFGHVKTLDPGFLAKLGSIDSTFCLSYTSGGQPMRYCDQPTNFTVSAGEAIGTAGPDFGAKDARVPALDFADTRNNPASPDGIDTLHGVCPVDYFRADLRTALQGMIGDVYGVARATQPWCGAIMQDVRATAQGRWFALGATRPGPDDPNLALVHDNDWNTTREVFSVGTSASASGLSPGVYFFHPTSTGNKNRDFKDVTADGAVYCYEQFSGVVMNGIEDAISSPTILIQLTSSTTLRLERRDESTCAAIGTWTFDERATDFER